MEPQLSPLKIRRGLSRSILAGTVGVVFFIVAVGQILTGFALRLGANSVQIGLIGALPLIVSPVQLLAAVLLERRGKRRPVWMITTVVHRAVWVAILAIPFVVHPVPSMKAVWCLILLLLVSWGFAAFSTPYWQSWIADLIPEGKGGEFWGRRTSLCTASAMISLVLLSRLLDSFPDERKFVGFALVFGIAVILGELDLIIHWGVPEPRMVMRERRPTVAEALRLPFTHKHFRGFIIAQGAWFAAVFLMAPFVNVFFLENLQLSYLTISVLNAVGQLAIVGSSHAWGFVTDRFGSKPVQKMCYALVAAYPLALVLCTKTNAMWVLVPASFVAGVANAGASVANMNLLLGLPPREGKSMYLAAYNSIVQIPGAIAPVLGGLLVRSIGDRVFWADGVALDALKVLFLVSAVARLAVLPLLNLVAEVSDRSVGYVVRQMFYGNPFRLVMGMVAYGRGDEKRRVKAARALGRSKSPLAVPGLARALDDPSRQVRGEAAKALGAMRSREAVRILLEKLKDPESGIQAESAEALGEIGDNEAVSALLERLGDADPSVRESVSWALGAIGDRRAAEPLLQSLENERDPRVFAALAEALAKLGEIRAIRSILPRMRQARLPALRRQLAVAVGNLIGRQGEFYRILEEEENTRGAAVARCLAAKGPLRLLPGVFDRVAEAEVRYESGDLAGFVRNLADAAFTVAAKILDRIAGGGLGETPAERVDIIQMALSFADAR